MENTIKIVSEYISNIIGENIATYSYCAHKIYNLEFPNMWSSG